MNKKQGDIIGSVILIGVIILAVSLGIWMSVYRYKDCKAVGHSQLYCIMSIGR